MVHDVAISYASEDGDRARELYDELRATNLSIYFDGDDTERVRSWGKDLRKNLRNIYGEARCCIVLLSNNYLASQWTDLELRSARNALPVVVGRLRPEHRRLHDLDWPAEGAAALIQHVLAKLEQLDEEQLERKRKRTARLKKGIGAFAGVAATVAATAAANRATQSRVEENTGPIHGHWTDSFGIAWEITQDGHTIELSGRAPDGSAINATGSRHGRSIRAQWASPFGQGAIKADIRAGGRRIIGTASGPRGPFPFDLSR